MKRPYGMAQRAFDAIIAAFAEVGINPEHTAQGGKRLLQTIGDAVASAGTHQIDGIDEKGNSYSAAVDISVRHDLTLEQIHKLLKALWHNGFAAWYRHTGSFANNIHIHACFVAIPMKRPLRNQIHSFLGHRSGLVGDNADEFVRDNLTEQDEQKLREGFLAHNPMNG